MTPIPCTNSAVGKSLPPACGARSDPLTEGTPACRRVRQIRRQTAGLFADDPDPPARPARIAAGQRPGRVFYGLRLRRRAGQLRRGHARNPYFGRVRPRGGATSRRLACGQGGLRDERCIRLRRGRRELRRGRVWRLRPREEGDRRKPRKGGHADRRAILDRAIGCARAPGQARKAYHQRDAAAEKTVLSGHGANTAHRRYNSKRKNQPSLCSDSQECGSIFF